MKCLQCNSDMNKEAWGYSCPQCHSNVFSQEYTAMCNKDYGFGIIQTTKESSYKQGWVCPKCGAVMSPDQPYCLFCKPVDTRVKVTTTGIMPTINTENKSISKGE